MRGGWGAGGGGIRGGMGWGGALAELGVGMLDWVVLAIRLVASPSSPFRCLLEFG